MQQFATALTRHLRSLGVWAWSHLDNFLIAHPDPIILANITRQFVPDLTQCGVRINPKDTQTHPTKTIKFLGFLSEATDAMISHTGARKDEIAALLKKLDQPLPLKTVERFVGHLVFYFSIYRGHYHMLTPPFRLLHKPVSLPPGYVATLQKVWQALPHRVPWTIRAPMTTCASDASDIGLGVTTPYGNVAILTTPARDIYRREAQALCIAALLAEPDTIILIANQALVQAVTRGHGRSVPWQIAVAISLLFVNKRLWSCWVPTDANPADAPSRFIRNQVPN
ncbi:hypothetical protein HPB47_004249 [Ixodes persulcatus]|uniref:Uncharacterized protein n=1 Tax=Ixodes persulcatus TaxID=34615 RepID=A0AC60PGC6_IXOPE|nr:hypothetical protein HPB47_004249 [Ixodes persulcatus]